MNLLRRYWLALLLVALSFVLVAISYEQLPARIPVHWNMKGEIDGWMARPWGALALPLVSLVVTLLMILASRAHSPALTERAMARVYPVLVASMAGFLLFLTAVILLVAMGSPLSVPRLIGAAMGVLFAIVGNYMGKVPRNGIVGIRLPWTLSSDEVWERTHRFAAPVMVAGGLLLFVVSLVYHGMQGALALLVILGATTGLTVVKSYFIWQSVRRREGRS